MNLEQVLENQQLKKRLENRKETKVKQRIQRIQRQKANLDQVHTKTGKIEKTKIIKKKIYETQFQRARKVPIQVQENANPSTYLSEPEEYRKILERTKHIVEFDHARLLNGCKAISAFAQANKQKTITIEIIMESPIVCHQAPVLIRLPYTNKSSCVIIAQNKQQMQSQITTLPNVNLKIVDLREYINLSKESKEFKKFVKNSLMLCDFNVFKKSKMMKKMLQNGRPVFPIDAKKVPYWLSENQAIETYGEYIQYLLNSCFAVTKAGKEHRIRIKNRGSQELSSNVESAVHQMIARLIYRNKAKGNKMIAAKLRTDTSIPIDIYG